MTPLPEPLRLEELWSFGVLDTPPDPAFDALVAVASHVASAPTALVSLVDEHRQWFKARVGLDAPETPRDVAFCDHVVQAAAPLVVPDATQDPRFRDNPLVTGPPGIRFYAGFPLVTRSGAVLGSLCVIDSVSHPDGLTAQQTVLMTGLAQQVVAQLELRRSLREHGEALDALRTSEERYRALAEQASDVVSRHAPDGTVLWVSPSVRAVLGHDPHAEVGAAAPDRVHPEDAAALARAVGQALGGTAATATVRSRHADGGYRWLEVRLSPLRGAADRVVELHSVARDVTDRVTAEQDAERRRHAERERAEADARYAQLLQDLPDPVLVHVRGSVVWANPAAERALGGGQPLVGVRMQELTDEQGPLVTGPDPVRARRSLRARDGRRLVVAVHARRVAWHGREAVQAVLHDVTEEEATATRLAASEERFRVLFTDNPAGQLELDPDGRVLSANAAFAALLGLPAATAAVGMPLGELVLAAAPDRAVLARRLARLRSGRAVEVEHALDRPDGTQVELHATLRAVRDAAGRTTHVLGSVLDVTARNAASRALQRSEQRFRAVFVDGPTPTARLDQDGRLREVNPALRRLLALPSDRLVGRRLSSLCAPQDDVAVGALLQGEGAREVRLLRGGRVPVWCEATATRSDGEVLLQLLDVDARVAQEHALEQAARRDPLTGLTNRLGLLTRLRALLADDGPGVALLFLDLDGFKAVNDTHGHDTGDAVLLEVAARLAASVRGEDLVARLGGDEFVVACPLPLGEPGAVQALGLRLEEALSAPMERGGRLLVCGASAGTSTARPGADAERALADADASMYRRKRVRALERRTPRTDGRGTSTERLAELVESALVQDRLALAYQPVVDARTGTVRGVEALLRPVGPDGAPLPLDAFLALAEQSGSITGIGRWVLRRALCDAAAWKAALPADLPFSVGVNVSPLQLHDPALHAHLAHALQESGLDPAAVVLEVTEGRLLADTRAVRDALEALQELGVHLAVDDFGSGYASVEYLRTLPFDVVKVDRSHTAALLDGDRRGRVARGVFALARETGLVVVAEGVETAAQREALLLQGVTLAQGWHWSRALPPEQLTALLVRAGHLPRGEDERRAAAG